MHSLRAAAHRLRRWQRLWGFWGSGGTRESARAHRVVPVVVSLVAVLGATTGVVLATVGGRPAGLSGASGTRAPGAGGPAAGARPAAGATPVVPMLGGTADGRGTSVRVPVARPPGPDSTGSASAGSASAGQAGATPAGAGASFGPASATTRVRLAPVAPLRGLHQADLLVVAPFSLSPKVLAAVSRQPGVTGAEPIEAAKVKINGSFTAVLGVDPSRFRGYAAGPTAKASQLWQGVAGGGIAVSYTMGKLGRLSLGGTVTVAGHRLERLPVVAFGTVGIGGVDAVVSDSVGRSLGMPARNAIVVSAPPADVASLAAQIKRVLPRGAAVEPLLTQVTRPSSAGLTPSEVAAAGFASSGVAAGAVPAAAGAMTSAQLSAALRAAESRRGMPYVWGADGPASFDCSGLVQWSFAQAGITMPRVAADQARAGMAVSVGHLAAGDLLFYHTDPTAPGYISHVAIYLGNGWMIQAPQPGMTVEIVPASFDSQFAGAVRVYPQIAARVAAGLA